MSCALGQKPIALRREFGKLSSPVIRIYILRCHADQMDDHTRPRYSVPEYWLCAGTVDLLMNVNCQNINLLTCTTIYATATHAMGKFEGNLRWTILDEPPWSPAILHSGGSILIPPQKTPDVKKKLAREGGCTTRVTHTSRWHHITVATGSLTTPRPPRRRQAHTVPPRAPKVHVVPWARVPWARGKGLWEEPSCRGYQSGQLKLTVFSGAYIMTVL